MKSLEKMYYLCYNRVNMQRVLFITTSIHFACHGRSEMSKKLLETAGQRDKRRKVSILNCLLVPRLSLSSKK